MLLQEGIGDTIRVSLTPEPGGDRTREVVVATPSLIEQLAVATPSVILEVLLTFLMCYFMVESRLRLRRQAKMKPR